MMEAPNITCPNCEREMNIILQDEQKSAWIIKYDCECGCNAKVILWNSGRTDKYIYDEGHNLLEYTNG
jgi:lysyl-tRNA synthetase class I